MAKVRFGTNRENCTERIVMDRRIKRTKAAVYAAFEELLSIKKYENITVQDIIDRADIGRSTFYAHFETKDDLLKALLKELFSHVLDNHPKAEGSHDFSSEDKNLRNYLTHILYHLKDDSKRYSRLFSCESSEIFWSYFRDQFFELVRDYTALPKGNLSGVPEDFYMNFYAGAFIDSVKWWFRRGLDPSPEELESYFEVLTAGRL